MSEYNILHDIFFFNFINSSNSYWFIYLNKYNFIYNFFYNFFYNFILIILIVYPIYNYIKLLIHLKSFLNEFYSFLPFWARTKAKYIIKYLIEEFPGPRMYVNLFHFYWYFRKQVFVRLILRYTEIKKEEKKWRYISKQFINYLYIRVVLTYFYGLFFRLFYFLICFFFKLFYFLIKKIIRKISYNSNWIILFKYLEYKLKIHSLYLGYNFFLKIFTFLNYIKLEFFTYFINSNNFMGGLIFYFYHGLTYYISKYNNHYIWLSDRLSNIYPEIIIYIYKYNYIYRYSFLLKKYLNFFLYFFLNIFLIHKMIFFKVYNIIYYIYILFKPITFFIFKLKIPIFFKNIYLRNIFIFIGFSWFFVYETLINIILYIFKKLLKLLFHFKYIIFIYFIYKFGIIYISIIYIFSIFIYFDEKYFIIFLWVLEYFFDFFGVLSYDLYDRFDNNLLINYWYLNYKISLEKTLLYFSFDMTFTNELIELILPEKDFLYRIFHKRSLIRYDRGSIWRKIKIYFANILNLIKNELSLFYLVSKDYILFKYLNIYNLYIYKWSGLNLYYYFLIKIMLVIYLSLIDMFFSIKLSYLSLLPSELDFLWWKIFYIFCKIWFYFYWINDIFKYFLLFFSYIFLCIFNFYYYYFKIYIYLIYFYFIYIFLYIYYYIIFIYLNIIDLQISFLNYISLSYYFNSDVFFYYFFNKKIIILRLKELLLNYLRIDINNLLEFRFANYTILGTKVRGILIYVFDYVELKEMKQRKINLSEWVKIDPSIVMHDFPAPRREDYFDYDYKNFRLNNFYFLYNFYKGGLIFHEIYPYNLIFHTWNFYLRNYLFLSNYISLYIIYYYIIFYFFRYIFKLKKNYKYNLNVNQIWLNLKNKFNYKLLKNDKLFIKALDFYQETNGKRKILNRIYNIVDIFWNFEKNNDIIKKNIKDIKNLNFYIEKIKLGSLCKNFIFNKNLNNYIIEKNMCYNDQRFFYWKRFILFGKDFDYYFKNSYDNKILYFFLALVFRRTFYAPLIFYYLDNYKKKYYYKTIFSKIIPKLNVYIIDYFYKLSNWLNLKKNYLLLDKDISLLIYKDESKKLNNNIYTINKVKILPDFLLEFFWLGFIFYLFFFRWCVLVLEYSNKFNARLAWIYLHNLISNVNLFYIYDISDYWFYNHSLFDTKNIAYESNKYNLFSYKFYKSIRKPRMSTRFFFNNDPLFSYKMNHAYHLHNLNIFYEVNLGTLNMQILNKFITIINFLFFIIFFLKGKYIILKYMNYNYIELINLLINYRKNIIKLKNYIFFKRKILS